MVQKSYINLFNRGTIFETPQNQDYDRFKLRKFQPLLHFLFFNLFLFLKNCTPTNILDGIFDKLFSLFTEEMKLYLKILCD